MPDRNGRLRRRSEYLRVARSGRKWVATGLILQASPCSTETRHVDGAAGLWVGFTVSRRVGKATKRNRARRRLRAAAAAVLPRLAAAGHEYVLIGREATLTRGYAALIADLEAALTRLGTVRTAGDGGRAAEAE